MHTPPSAQPDLSDSIDDIFHQARQGSVAAIIQILNDRLADSGVRTRAVLSDGILQILCEAATPEQLDPSKLVGRVQQILEAIAPRNIRRVTINSRIVREQQLLWLEEIRRDPQGQLLWSESIVLSRQNPIRRFFEDRKIERLRSRSRPQATQSKPKKQGKNLYLRGAVGGISLLLVLGLIGWALQDWLGFGTATNQQIASETSDTPAASDTNPDANPNETGAANPDSAAVSQEQDPFAQAVELATQASADGMRAETPTDWLDLATRWQRASDLMAQVSADDQRYPLAQRKVKEYQANSDIALRQAEQLRNQNSG